MLVGWVEFDAGLLIMVMHKSVHTKKVFVAWAYLHMLPSFLTVMKIGL